MIFNQAVKPDLYFLAIIPDEPLRVEVKALKEEIREHFGVKHALKSPAHITLIPPFKRELRHLTFLSDSLVRFAGNQIPFTVYLSRFGSFPTRVIYIDIVQPEPIIWLHSDLCKTLLDEFLFHPNELKGKFHPHMTLATRDLTPEAYQKAWPEYKNRIFNAKIDVKSVFLLKHNGKYWDIHREFCFRNN